MQHYNRYLNAENLCVQECTRLVVELYGSSPVSIKKGFTR